MDFISNSLLGKTAVYFKMSSFHYCFKFYEKKVVPYKFLTFLRAESQKFPKYFVVQHLTLRLVGKIAHCQHAQAGSKLH